MAGGIVNTLIGPYPVGDLDESQDRYPNSFR